MRTFAGFRRRTGGSRVGGFTRSDLVVILILVVMGLVLAAAEVVRPNRGRKSVRIQCVNNLKQFGISYRVFSEDNGLARGLAQVTNAVQYRDWLLSMSNELTTARVLVCPTDRKQRADVAPMPDLARPDVGLRAVSWFVMPSAREERPQLVLAGDRSLEGRPPQPPFGYRAPRAVVGKLVTDVAVLEQSLKWTPNAMHRAAGNVVMADGSVQMLTDRRLWDVLAGTGGGTNSGENLLIQPGQAPD